jgi:hypothetical protein
VEKVDQVLHNSPIGVVLKLGRGIFIDPASLNLTYAA